MRSMLSQWRTPAIYEIGQTIADAKRLLADELFRVGVMVSNPHSARGYSVLFMDPQAVLAALDRMDGKEPMYVEHPITGRLTTWVGDFPK